MDEREPLNSINEVRFWNSRTCRFAYRDNEADLSPRGRNKKYKGGVEMFGYGWLNLGSLVLGLIAWILPFVSTSRNRVALSMMSMGACAVSLCFQIFYINHKVKVADWSAL